MHVGRRVAAVICVAALALVACSDDAAAPDPSEEATTEAAGPTESETVAPTPTETPTPTASATEDPFAVPDEITPAYADRVINALYAEWGDITREALQIDPSPTTVVPGQLKDRAADIFSGEYLLKRLNELDAMARGERAELLPADEFGQLVAASQQIKIEGASCIVSAGTFSTRQTAVTETELIVAYSLERVDGNPTGWKLRDVLANIDTDGNPLPDERMFEDSFADLEPFLDNTCEGAS